MLCAPVCGTGVHSIRCTYVWHRCRQHQVLLCLMLYLFLALQPYLIVGPCTGGEGCEEAAQERCTKGAPWQRSLAILCAHYVSVTVRVTMRLRVRVTMRLNVRVTVRPSVRVTVRAAGDRGRGMRGVARGMLPPGAAPSG